MNRIPWWYKKTKMLYLKFLLNTKIRTIYFKFKFANPKYLITQQKSIFISNKAMLTYNKQKNMNKCVQIYN